MVGLAALTEAAPMRPLRLALARFLGHINSTPYLQPFGDPLFVRLVKLRLAKGVAALAVLVVHHSRVFVVAI